MILLKKHIILQLCLIKSSFFNTYQFFLKNPSIFIFEKLLNEIFFFEFIDLTWNVLSSNIIEFKQQFITFLENNISCIIENHFQKLITFSKKNLKNESEILIKLLEKKPKYCLLFIEKQSQKCNKCLSIQILEIQFYYNHFPNQVF